MVAQHLAGGGYCVYQPQYTGSGRSLVINTAIVETVGAYRWHRVNAGTVHFRQKYEKYRHENLGARYRLGFPDIINTASCRLNYRQRVHDVNPK